MKIVWLICLTLIVNVGMAQTTYLGIKAGGHASSAYIEHTVFNLSLKSTVLPGTSGGVFVRYLSKKKDAFLNSGIQLGANYVQKGWKQTFLTNEPSYTARMNYLEIPLEGFGYFGGKNKYFFSLGIYMEFLLSVEKDAEPNSDNTGGADFYTYDATRNDPDVGYGGRLSGGVFRELAIGTLQIEGFFSYSLSNFIEPGDLTKKTPDISNHWSIGLTLGYMVALWKVDK